MAAGAEPTRAEDQDVVALLDMAVRDCGILEMAETLDRDVIWVVEMLHAHRDAFVAAWAH